MKRKLAMVMEKRINFDNDLSTGVCFYKIYNKSKNNYYYYNVNGTYLK